MGRGTRTFAVLLGAVSLLLVGAASASASYHEIKIRSIFLGPSDSTAFVELQMYNAGQNLVFNHPISIWNNDGTSGTLYPLPNNVTNAESQRTILIRDAGSVLPADFKIPGFGSTLSSRASGGSVCWDVVDCVGWGSVTSAPSPVGTPISGNLSTNQVNVRRIDRGCPTALDAADDTNDSSADFGFAVGYPVRDNSAAPTETLCGAPLPYTGYPKAKKKCKKHKKKTGAYSAKKKKCKKKKHR